MRQHTLFLLLFLAFFLSLFSFAARSSSDSFQGFSSSQQTIPERACDLVHFNASLARHFSLSDLASFKPLGDLERKLFAAELWDESQGSFVLFLYHLGKDAVFSDDDTVLPLGATSPSSTTSPLLQISRHPLTGKESLFWVTRAADLTTTIFSCALPGCSSPTKEATFSNYHLFVMTPSLQQQKIFFLLMDKTTREDALLSCSLDAPTSDWCGLDEGNYTLHRRSTAPSLEMQTVRDQGIAWKQTFTGNYFFFSLHTQTVLSLPAGVQMRALGNFLGTSQVIFFRHYQREGRSVGELSVVDLVTGSATTMDSLPADSAPLLIDSYKSQISTFYHLDGAYSKKNVGHSSVTVLSDFLNLWHVKHVAQLSNGLVVASIFPGRGPLDVVGFTCTP